MDNYTPQRFRDFELIPGHLPTGPRNLISDVPGVTVGHAQVNGPNNIRTGLTLINPTEENIFRHRLPASVAVGNGYGKSAGTTQIIEMGIIETPIALTNTHAVGAAIQGLLQLTQKRTSDIAPYDSINAVVGETNDWIINSIHTPSVQPSHVEEAWENRGADFELGCVGAGTGTRAFSFKGGIGSSSRMVRLGEKSYTVGALVQTNFGGVLTMMGVPVGPKLGEQDSYMFAGPSPDGSCMIVLATDAPLDSRQLNRLAKRGLIGMTRTGSIMANSSGDYAIAFSTQTTSLGSIDDNDLNPFFIAAAEAVEESIYDALFTARDTTGRNGNTLHQIPVEKTVAIIKDYLK